VSPIVHLDLTSFSPLPPSLPQTGPDGSGRTMGYAQEAHRHQGMSLPPSLLPSLPPLFQLTTPFPFLPSLRPSLQGLPLRACVPENFPSSYVEWGRCKDYTHIITPSLPPSLPPSSLPPPSLQGRPLRACVPKNFPYFYAEWGRGEGYAHIVEDREQFPKE